MDTMLKMLGSAVALWYVLVVVLVCYLAAKGFVALVEKLAKGGK